MRKLSTIGLAAALFGGGCNCGGGGSPLEECPVSASPGTVDVTVNPGGTPIDVSLVAHDGSRARVTGPAVVTLPAGPMTFEARRTRTSGPIVGTAYVATASVAGGVAPCVRTTGTTAVTITATADPASNRLWATDLPVIAIAAADLEVSGSPAPAASLTGTLTNPRTAAFDLDGALWMTDANRVVAFANADLGAGGPVAPAIVLSGPSIDDGSVPGVVEIAFDAQGTLWVAHAARDRVMRFAPTAIRASGSPTPMVTVNGPSVSGPGALAFDAAGNLWVSGDAATIDMFAASRLGANITTAADVSVTGRTPGPVIGGLGSAASMAFDDAGNLWTAHFGPNVIARYTPADLAATGTVTPTIQVRVPVDVLLDDIAIDEAGGIWLTGGSGRVSRLSPAQLTASGNQTPETILTPTGLAYAASLAFYPPAAGLPIAF